MTLLVAVGSASLGWAVADHREAPRGVTRRFEPGFITAPVVRRSLSTRLVGRADVRASIARPIQVHGVDGDAVVTQGVARLGSVVRSGDVLLEISGRPVLVISGAIPNYRDLRPGDRGRDVDQLRAALAGLGLRTDDAPGLYGPSTASAVGRWYQSRGYDPAPPPPDLVAAADEAHQALMSGRADAASAQNEVASAPGDPAALAHLNLAVANVADAEQAQDAARAALEPGVPRRELVTVGGLPLRLGRGLATGADAEPQVATLVGGPPVATATVDATDATDLGPGTAGRLDDEAGTTWPVVVLRASTAASARGTGDPPTSKTRLTLGFAKNPPALEGRNVRLTIVLGATRRPALVVPTAALRTSGDGAARVDVVAHPRDVDAAVRAVAVRVGPEAGGVLTIVPEDPNALHEGDRVVLGQERPRGGTHG